PDLRLTRNALNEHHRRSTSTTERSAHDGMFSPRRRKPNEGPFPILRSENVSEHSNRVI
ncbi:hypothetical protein A2U01_0119197, partial [Trifolium medium]|nr:hypothetical protein [Trifolium medium]